MPGSPLLRAVPVSTWFTSKTAQHRIVSYLFMECDHAWRTVFGQAASFSIRAPICHPLTTLGTPTMPPSRHLKSGGCWICKLRRKKCNESRSTCVDGANLRIECQYGPRPLWMDGGPLQRQKAALLKEVIEQTAHRREQARINKVTAPDKTKPRFHVLSDMTVSASTLAAQSTTPSRQGDPTPVQSRSTISDQEPNLVDTLPWSYQQHQRSDTLEHASVTEWNFIVKYIDHVFPAIFHFYQPSVFDTGRSWLLLLLRKNGIAYHAALGLSCYYFTMALSDAEMGSEQLVDRRNHSTARTGPIMHTLLDAAPLRTISKCQRGFERH